MSSVLKLNETVKQTYKYQTKGKSPTEVQHELKAMGIEGFVIRMTNIHVTIRVPKENKIINRKCLKDGRVENKFLSNKNYIRHQRLYDGMQYLFKTDDTDNYFSVVKHQISYGYKEGLYEFAKCKQINGINHLISEPIGYLSVEKY